LSDSERETQQGSKRKPDASQEAKPKDDAETSDVKVVSRRPAKRRTTRRKKTTAGRGTEKKADEESAEGKAANAEDAQVAADERKVVSRRPAKRRTTRRKQPAKKAEAGASKAATDEKKVESQSQQDVKPKAVTEEKPAEKSPETEEKTSGTEAPRAIAEAKVGAEAPGTGAQDGPEGKPSGAEGGERPGTRAKGEAATKADGASVTAQGQRTKNTGRSEVAEEKPVAIGTKPGAPVEALPQHDPGTVVDDASDDRRAREDNEAVGQHDMTWGRRARRVETERGHTTAPVEPAAVRPRAAASEAIEPAPAPAEVSKPAEPEVAAESSKPPEAPPSEPVKAEQAQESRRSSRRRSSRRRRSGSSRGNVESGARPGGDTQRQEDRRPEGDTRRDSSRQSRTLAQILAETWTEDKARKFIADGFIADLAPSVASDDIPDALQDMGALREPLRQIRKNLADECMVEDDATDVMLLDMVMNALTDRIEVYRLQAEDGQWEDIEQILNLRYKADLRLIETIKALKNA